MIHLTLSNESIVAHPLDADQLLLNCRSANLFVVKCIERTNLLFLTGFEVILLLAPYVTSGCFASGVSVFFFVTYSKLCLKEVFNEWFSLFCLWDFKI